jgi:hypothetical protein
MSVLGRAVGELDGERDERRLETIGDLLVVVYWAKSGG